MEEGIAEGVEAARKKEEFVRVVSKQAREEYAERKGSLKKHWKPNGDDGDKEEGDKK